VNVRPGLPFPGVRCHQVQEPLSPVGPVQGLGLRLQFRWPRAEHEGPAIVVPAGTSSLRQISGLIPAITTRSR
jgi:hypothetical protein